MSQNKTAARSLILSGTLITFSAMLSACSGDFSISGISSSPASAVSLASSGQIRAAAQQQGYLTIMPLGDSITYGYRAVDPDGNSGGYRSALYNDLQMNFHFVGSQSNGPVDLPELNHEGHPGYQIADLQNEVDGWIAQNPSDIILLHIGTNDILNDNDDGAPDRLSDLLNQILDDAPNEVIFVAKIIPNAADPSYNARVDAFNEGVQAVVENYQNMGYPMFVVDMNTAFNRNTAGDLSQDLYHPSLKGYEKLAVRWANAVNRAAAEGYFPNASPRGQYTPVYVPYYPAVSTPRAWTIPNFAGI